MSEAVTILMQVTSFHEGPWGGGVMIGRQTTGRAVLLRARIARRVLPRCPVDGEVWRVSGTIARYPVRNPKTGALEQLEHVDAVWAAPAPPQGAAIRRWIARNPAIPGVGEGYAERLWDAFGDRLYDVIRTRDVQALAEVLDVPKATAIVEAFGLLLDEVTALQDLDGMGVDGATASAAVRLFGADAARRFRENPYAMTLMENWEKVDSAALASGMATTDPRRLLATVDVAAAQAFRTTENSLGGHTVVTHQGLAQRIRVMLGRFAPDQARAAIQMAIDSGALHTIAQGRYQARGPHLMEREIEGAVVTRLSRIRPPFDRATVAVAISEVERSSGFQFEPEQHQAVLTALSAGLAIIDGGAGTGKSTIIKAVLHAHRRLRRGEIVQVALSGRAAKRLAEATGKPAMTVYRFLKDLEAANRVMQRGLVVIDEFSMVGTPDLWLLLTSISVEVDVLLVGDPAQLPPIKAGNPAQALCASPSVPRVTLGRIHRQAASTGIPQIAGAIRQGDLPDLPEFDESDPSRPGVFMASCQAPEIGDTVLKVFAAAAGLPDGQVSASAIRQMHDVDVQVLAMTRRGPAGAMELCEAIEKRWLFDQEPIHDWGMRAGSKILWVRNSYNRPTGRRRADGSDETIDLMNGALGVVRRPTSAGAEIHFDDGTVAEIVTRDLADVLRGWAITVHKAQGSAFRTVIIPIIRSRLLDRAMLYTAVTRARERVVLVGDIALARGAAAKAARASQRLQALNFDGGSARKD